VPRGTVVMTRERAQLARKIQFAARALDVTAALVPNDVAVVWAGRLRTEWEAMSATERDAIRSALAAHGRDEYPAEAGLSVRAIEFLDGATSGDREKGARSAAESNGACYRPGRRARRTGHERDAATEISVNRR